MSNESARPDKLDALYGLVKQIRGKLYGAVCKDFPNCRDEPCHANYAAWVKCTEADGIVDAHPTCWFCDHPEEGPGWHIPGCPKESVEESADE